MRQPEPPNGWRVGIEWTTAGSRVRVDQPRSGPIRLTPEEAERLGCTIAYYAEKIATEASSSR